LFRYGLEQEGYVGVSRSDLRKAENNIGVLNRELDVGEALEPE
jgi:hypothetical protein